MNIRILTKWLAAGLLALTATLTIHAEVTVKDVKATPRWPWNGMVDIDYTIVSDDPNVDVWAFPQGFDNDRKIAIAPRTLIGDGANNVATKPGKRRMTWDARADDPKLNSSNFTISMQVFSGASLYMVIDLSGGADAATYPVSYSSTAPNLDDDTCRTTEMWFRLILPGTFMMGSPSSELGRGTDETLHQVTLTKPFYIGVFQVTQKQYSLITGGNSSRYTGDTRPVGNISYDALRGTVSGAQWPTNNQVDTTSVMGKLRAKTSMTIDLPTEAQWEYACRAGTSTALNNGNDLTVTGACPNMAEVGRYSGNLSDGKGGSAYNSYYTKVGMYRPNAWGLYDMHGNIWEWCLDRYVASLGTASVTDPKGPASGNRILRGGSFAVDASTCRSARRSNAASSSNLGDSYYSGGTFYHYNLGFRAAYFPQEQ